MCKIKVTLNGIYKQSLPSLKCKGWINQFLKGHKGHTLSKKNSIKIKLQIA